MKKFQKSIAIILIIGLVLSVNFNLFIFKPKQAQAVVDIIGGPSNVVNLIKEIALDAVAWTIKDRVINVLKQKIMDWGTGRKSPTNEPFAITDWVQFFRKAVNEGAAKWINEEYDLTFDMSDSFESTMKSNLDSLGFDVYPEDVRGYAQYAKPTLKDDLGDKYQDFVDSGFSLLHGGWAGWFSMTKPQNNIFGQILMAERARQTSEEAAKEAADKRTAVSRGYENETAAAGTDTDQCKSNCAANYPATISVPGAIPMPNPALAQCIQKCDARPGIVMKKKIKNLGSTIEKSMNDALGADMAKILQVDEISEILGIIFSAVLNRAIDGMGLAFQAATGTSKQRARTEQTAQFSYLRNFQKAQTPQQKQDVRSNVLYTILKAIQSLNRTGILCKEDEMVKYTEWIKNVSSILHPNVESLYVGLTGSNLSPDFEVLDPLYAPYSVYGYSWGHVPAVKLPSKCRKITDQLNLGLDATCRWIKSGLEPNYDSRCEQCMYDHDALNCPPGDTPPLPYPQQIPETIIKQKQDFFNACRGPYLATLDRCDECVKRVDEKCDQADPAQKQQCITNNCSNYGNLSVVSPPADGLDFYEKCLVEEKKDACYVCLKEYYMPATYCDQTADYVSRAIDKYPTVVKRNRKGGDDKGEFWGPYDSEIAGRGDECDDNYDHGPMNLALLCRIMPDFSYGGVNCRNTCMNNGMTEEQLRDITDFRPNDKDCNNVEISSIGGRNPWNPINDGAMAIRGKCCAASWQHDPEKYAICVGSGATAESTPPEHEEEQVCHNGAGINPHTGETSPDGGETNYGFANTNINIERSNTPFIYMVTDNGAYDWGCTILRSISPQVDDVTVYVTKPYCDAYRGSGNKLYWSDINGDNIFSNSFVKTHDTHGEMFSYCCNSPLSAPYPDGPQEWPNPSDCVGGFKSPPADKILCTFDIDAPIGSPNGPTGLDPATGEPYKACCGLSQGHDIQYTDRNACISAGVPAEICNDYPRYMTGGLYIIAVPDKPDSLGGAQWCACSSQSWCGERCANAMCTVNTTPQ